MYFMVPVAATGVAAAIMIWIDVYVMPRKHANAKRAAVRDFVRVFSDADRQFATDDAYLIMADAKEEHDAAIFNFRRHLAASLLEDFDALVLKFNQCRGQLVPASEKVARSIQSGRALDNTDAHEMKSAINALLRFGEGILQR